MGIIVAAIITTLLAAAAYGYLIRRITAPDDRRVVLIAALVALPLQPLAFYAVRMPVAHWLIVNIGLGDLFTAISLFHAPLTEEPLPGASESAVPLTVLSAPTYRLAQASVEEPRL